MLNMILICDTETTGLDPAKDAPVEVAWARYSLADRAVLESFSFLVDPRTYRPELQHEEVRDLSSVHGITQAMWQKRGRPWASVHKSFTTAAADVDAIVAHNAAFDRRWLDGEAKMAQPWICTLHDVAWPSASGNGKNLIATALAHDVSVVAAHRAMTDVDVLCRLLTRVAKDGHDVVAMLERGLRPKAEFVVAATDFDEARNALAREHGFRWAKDQKRWVRTMAIEDAKALPFEVRQVA